MSRRGSTALQIQLMENRDTLEALGFYLPATGVHFDERIPGVRRTDGHRFLFSPNGTERDWSKLKEELDLVDLSDPLRVDGVGGVVAGGLFGLVLRETFG